MYVRERYSTEGVATEVNQSKQPPLSKGHGGRSCTCIAGLCSAIEGGAGGGKAA